MLIAFDSFADEDLKTQWDAKYVNRKNALFAARKENIVLGVIPTRAHVSQRQTNKQTTATVPHQNKQRSRFLNKVSPFRAKLESCVQFNTFNDKELQDFYSLSAHLFLLFRLCALGKPPFNMAKYWNWRIKQPQVFQEAHEKLETHVFRCTTSSSDDLQTKKVAPSSPMRI